METNLKPPADLERCPVGCIINLTCTNGKTYSGIFKGIQGDRAVVQSVYSGQFKIPFKISHIVGFEIVENDEK